jgi:hypothetical protein
VSLTHGALLERSATLAATRPFLARNPGTASLFYNLEVGKGGRLNDEDVLRAVRQSVIVRIEPDLPDSDKGA